MTGLLQLQKLERFVANDSRLLSTLLSCAITLAIYINLSVVRSFAVGIIAFFLYFMINAIFLAHAFFEKEDTFFGLMFGVLFLIMILGSVGWLVMIIYNLDTPEFTLVLFIVATFSSLMNKRVKNKNVA